MPTKELHSSTLWWATNTFIKNMNKNYKKWTNEEDVVIVSMRAKGSSGKEIAKALNRTYSSTHNRINFMIAKGEISKKKRCNKVATIVEAKRKSTIDYYEVAKRVAENPGNLQAVFRKYAKEIGVTVETVHRAYYNPSQSRTRIKDLVHIFTVVGQKGFGPNNSKNFNEPIKRSNIWLKFKEWLYSSLLS